MAMILASAFVASVFAAATGGPGHTVPTPALSDGSDFPLRFDHKFSTGAQTYNSGVGDLNGDGLDDLTVAEWTGDRVEVWYQNSSGLGGSPTVLSGISHPITARVGDLTGDGRDDLLVIPEFSAMLIYPQNGTGGLATPVTVATGCNQVNGELADLNGDSRLDVLLAQRDCGRVALFLQLESGTLGAPTYLTANYASSVVAADLNGDGLADVAATDYSRGEVNVIYQGAGLTFPTTKTYTVEGTPALLAAADVNRDGRVDLEVSRGGAVPAWSLLLQASNGSLESARFYEIGGNDVTLNAVDLDGNGAADVFVTDGDGHHLHVFVWNGSDMVPAKILPTSGHGGDVRFGDFNYDGRLDVSVGGTFNATVDIFLQTLVVKSELKVTPRCINPGPQGGITLHLSIASGDAALLNLSKAALENTSAALHLAKTSGSKLVYEVARAAMPPPGGWFTLRIVSDDENTMAVASDRINVDAECAKEHEGQGHPEHFQCGGPSQGPFPVTVIASGFQQPTALDINSHGDIYVTEDLGASIKKIEAGSLVVSTVLSGGAYGMVGAAFDAQDNFWFSEYWDGNIKRIANGSTSPVTVANLGGSGPRGVDTDAAGNLYVARFNGNTVYKVTPSGDVTTVVTVGGNVDVESVAVNSRGDVFFDHYGAIWWLPAGSTTPSVLINGTHAAHLYVDVHDNLYYLDSTGENDTIGSCLVRLAPGSRSPDTLTRLPKEWPYRMAERNGSLYIAFLSGGYVGKIDLPTLGNETANGATPDHRPDPSQQQERGNPAASAESGEGKH